MCPRVLVIIPAFNEEAAIGRVIGDIPGDIVDEVVVVDNGSSDATARNARSAGAVVVREDRQGYGRACLRGIAYAQRCDPKIVVFLDGDYSDHPQELPALIAPILRDQADFVVGSRVRGERAAGALPPHAYWGNRLASLFMRWRWNAPFTDLGPFRAIRFGDLLSLDMQDKTYGWTIEMQIKALRANLRCAEVPVSYRQRMGTSKISGTLGGTLRASAKILATLGRFAVKQ